MNAARPRWRCAVLRLAAALLALVAAAVLVRAGLATSTQPPLPPTRPVLRPADSLAQRLADAVRIETVSVDGQPDASAAAFLQLHRHLEASFPAAHRALRRETVNGYSLLYTWPGRDPRAAPIVLVAHQDVVPAPPAERWTHPPFAGVIADGYVWGRGAWDNKGNLYAMLAAIDDLAAAGFVPRQTVLLVAGHDEEMGSQAGLRGARAVAGLLRERGVHASFVLDEGLLVTHGVMSGSGCRSPTWRPFGLSTATCSKTSPGHRAWLAPGRPHPLPGIDEAALASGQHIA